MISRRYIAEYVTPDALHKACTEHPDNWLDVLEYGEVVGTTAEFVIEQAAKLDVNDEAHCVRSQHWRDEYNRWEDDE